MSYPIPDDGPVGQMLGQDYSRLRMLAQTNRHSIPVVAIGLQALLALGLLWAEPEQIILYLEFVLNLSLAATVFGVIVLRWRQPNLHSTQSSDMQGMLQ